jgi:GDPmannose 4,6-dehydratase
MKSALITGITGQDGSYLAELLLEKGYKVTGVVRRASTYNLERIEHIKDRLSLPFGDLSDPGSLRKIIDDCQPDEVYNLGAQSHVKISFEAPEYSADITGTGAVRLLQAIKGSKARYYQASSSEMFGMVQENPQRETTPFYPRSPYGCAKLYAYWITKNYRESYGMHASNGILFNHESPRRGENFVTRKITLALARILAGTQHELLLGNLDAKRDWGHAKDFVEAQWLMLQQDLPDDYVIATGETYSIRDFLDEAFTHANRDWRGFVVANHPDFVRPAEVDLLLGNATKAKEKLGWTPKVTFKQLVREMVDADIEYVRKYG